MVKGKGGELKFPLLPHCAVLIHDEAGVKEARVSIMSADRQAQANWGTMAALIKNAVHGVNAGYEKKLQLEGIGYRASVEGKSVVLALGFSHPVNFPLPEGITAVVVKNILTISGINKEIVGKVAADIRKLKKPEPCRPFPPDLEITRLSVFPNPAPIARCVRSIPSGSVLSRKNTRILSSAAPSASAASCGPRAEPPMPITSRFSNFSPRGLLIAPEWI